MWHTDRTGAFSTCSVPVLGWCGQFGGYNKISDLACHDSICYCAGGCGGDVFRGLILGAYMNVDTRAAVFISSLFFALLHFSLGSVLYGFFYGCVFVLIRIATGNMVYSMVMHLIFNAINVAVSYAGMIMIPGWFLIGAFIVCVIGFIVLSIFFFKKNPVELHVSGYKGRQLVTKEGYITMAVCLCVTGMLLMV